MPTETIKNYTDAQTAELVKAYTSENIKTDEQRAAIMAEFEGKFARSLASIRSKLVIEKVYIKPAKTNKAGGVIMRKSDIVTLIASAIGEAEEDLDSLEKATKHTLEKVLKASLRNNVLAMDKDLLKDKNHLIDQIVDMNLSSSKIDVEGLRLVNIDTLITFMEAIDTANYK